MSGTTLAVYTRSPVVCTAPTGTGRVVEQGGVHGVGTQGRVGQGGVPGVVYIQYYLVHARYPACCHPSPTPRSSLPASPPHPLLVTVSWQQQASLVAGFQQDSPGPITRFQAQTGPDYPLSGTNRARFLLKVVKTRPDSS